MTSRPRRGKSYHRHHGMAPVTDTPVAGHYKIRRVKGGPFVPVRIWLGGPLDPITGEELERGWQWRAERDGDQVPVEWVWPRCAPYPIDRAEYLAMRAGREWDQKYDPTAPAANPTKPVDLQARPAIRPPRRQTT